MPRVAKRILLPGTTRRGYSVHVRSTNTVESAHLAISDDGQPPLQASHGGRTEAVSAPRRSRRSSRRTRAARSARMPTCSCVSTCLPACPRRVAGADPPAPHRSSLDYVLFMQTCGSHSPAAAVPPSTRLLTRRAARLIKEAAIESKQSGEKSITARSVLRAHRRECCPRPALASSCRLTNGAVGLY